MIGIIMVNIMLGFVVNGTLIRQRRDLFRKDWRWRLLQAARHHKSKGQQRRCRCHRGFCYQQGIRNRNASCHDFLRSRPQSRMPIVNTPPRNVTASRNSTSDILKPYQTVAAVSNFASPPPIALAAKSAKQTKNTAVAAAMLIAKVCQSMPVNGATTTKESSNIRGILLGMVMLNRSFSAAKATHKGKVRKIAATTIGSIPQRSFLHGWQPM